MQVSSDNAVLGWITELENATKAMNRFHEEDGEYRDGNFRRIPIENLRPYTWVREMITYQEGDFSLLPPKRFILTYARKFMAFLIGPPLLMALVFWSSIVCIIKQANAVKESVKKPSVRPEELEITNIGLILGVVLSPFKLVFQFAFGCILERLAPSAIVCLFQCSLFYSKFIFHTVLLIIGVALCLPFLVFLLLRFLARLIAPIGRILVSPFTKRVTIVKSSQVGSNVPPAD